MAIIPGPAEAQRLCALYVGNTVIDEIESIVRARGASGPESAASVLYLTDLTELVAITARERDVVIARFVVAEQADQSADWVDVDAELHRREAAADDAAGAHERWLASVDRPRYIEPHAFVERGPGQEPTTIKGCIVCPDCYQPRKGHTS